MKNQKGFTVIEVLASFTIITIIFGMLTSILLTSLTKSDYISADSSILRGESSIKNWMQTDYREHKIVEIEKTSDKKGLIFIYEEEFKNAEGDLVIEEKEIIYENRSNGFYRADDKMSLLLFRNKIDSVSSNKDIIKLTYNLGGESKTITMKLEK